MREGWTKVLMQLTRTQSKMQTTVEMQFETWYNIVKVLRVGTSNLNVTENHITLDFNAGKSLASNTQYTYVELE